MRVAFSGYVLETQNDHPAVHLPAALLPLGIRTAATAAAESSAGNHDDRSFSAGSVATIFIVWIKD